MAVPFWDGYSYGHSLPYSVLDGMIAFMIFAPDSISFPSEYLGYLVRLTPNREVRRSIHVL